MAPKEDGDPAWFWHARTRNGNLCACSLSDLRSQSSHVRIVLQHSRLPTQADIVLSSRPLLHSEPKTCCAHAAASLSFLFSCKAKMSAFSLAFCSIISVSLVRSLAA